MTEFIEDLVAKIDIELAPIHAEIQQLQLARAALINDTRPAPAARAKPRARRKAGTPTTDQHPVIPAGKLVATLSATGGQSSLALASATGGAVVQIRELLKVLEQDGQVRREGHARGLRWFARTDKDQASRARARRS